MVIKEIYLYLRLHRAELVLFVSCYIKVDCVFDKLIYKIEDKGVEACDLYLFVRRSSFLDKCVVDELSDFLFFKLLRNGILVVIQLHSLMVDASEKARFACFFDFVR